MADALLDALLDSLKVFPFLFLMYVLIEFLESRTSVTRNKISCAGTSRRCSAPRRASSRSAGFR